MLQLSVQSFKEQFLHQSHYLLVDVREPSETLLGVIPGAILCPLGQISELDLGEFKSVVIYCKAGGRSMLACQYLDQTTSGIELYNLEGGFDQFSHE
ncbi:rhodanese-like domain-containing protein [Gammaproteobacteria bacterium]|nr:rhodanese-like domain-containing protein [Gammaproteobacteria bacterium]